MTPPDVSDAAVDCVIEIRGVYDGWSVAKMKDGSYINRWPEGDRRYQPTQDFIDRLRTQENADG